MERPKYEPGPLKAGIIQAGINIRTFERGIEEEEKRIEEYNEHIAEWEEYNKWLSSSTGPTK